MLAAKYLNTCNQALELSNEKIHALLQELDGFRRIDRCVHVLNIMREVNKVLGLPVSPSLEFLAATLAELIKIKLDTKEMRNIDGKAIADKLTTLRCQAIEELRKAR